VLTVKQISALDCYTVRHQVLWPHKHFDDCGIDIDNQEGAFHLGTYSGEKLLSIASFFKQSNSKFTYSKQYRLRAMATVLEAQKKGAARLLIQSAIELLKAQQQELLWCDARIIATGFYEKLDFLTLGESYEIPIIGTHYLMYKKL
jgi:predicted GNAT family N-acyltransferase